MASTGHFVTQTPHPIHTAPSVITAPVFSTREIEEVWGKVMHRLIGLSWTLPCVEYGQRCVFGIFHLGKDTQ